MTDIETVGWFVAVGLVFLMGLCLGRAWQITAMKAAGRYYDPNRPAVTIGPWNAATTPPTPAQPQNSEFCRCLECRATGEPRSGQPDTHEGQLPIPDCQHPKNRLMSWEFMAVQHNRFPAPKDWRKLWCLDCLHWTAQAPSQTEA